MHVRDRRARYGFAYDNERPRHRTDVRGYLIGQTPITNATLPDVRRGRRLRAPRVVVGRGLGVEGAVRHHATWRLDGGSRRRVAPREARARSIRTGPSSTSPGSRPTPSPARTTPASPPRSSGRRQRPGTRNAREGSPISVGRRSPRPRRPRERRPVWAAAPRGGRPTPPVPRPPAAWAWSATTWEWTASDFAGYPGFVAHPYKEYSEVFFGTDYRVLRGGSWAHARARDHADLPQLGLPTAPADLLRHPDREGSVTMRSLIESEEIRIDSWLSESEERSLANDVLDGLTRPFKELPPKHFYDARGSELFERICELPEYYPTRTEKAILRASAPGTSSQAHRRRRARRARLGIGRRRHGSCSTRWQPPEASAATSRSTSPRRSCAKRPQQLVAGVRRAAGPRRDRRLPAPPRARPGPRWRRRGSSRCSAARSATSRPARDAACCATSARVLGPEDRLLLGTDLVKDPAVIEAAYDDAPESPPSSTATSCT